MTELKIVAKAIFFIEGDESASEYQAMIVEREGVRWLVANWIEETATGKRIPAELIPMASLAHVVQEDGLVRLGFLVPMELLSSPMPQRLRLAYGVVDNPELVHAPGPAGIH